MGRACDPLLWRARENAINVGLEGTGACSDERVIEEYCCVHMTGSATRLTAGVQGRSLLSKVRVNGAWTQMSMPLLNVLFVG